MPTQKKKKIKSLATINIKNSFFFHKIKFKGQKVTNNNIF